MFLQEARQYAWLHTRVEAAYCARHDVSASSLRTHLAVNVPTGGSPVRVAAHARGGGVLRAPRRLSLLVAHSPRSQCSYRWLASTRGCTRAWRRRTARATTSQPPRCALTSQSMFLQEARQYAWLHTRVEAAYCARHDVSASSLRTHLAVNVPTGGSPVRVAAHARGGGVLRAPRRLSLLVAHSPRSQCSYRWLASTRGCTRAWRRRTARATTSQPPRCSLTSQSMFLQVARQYAWLHTRVEAAYCARHDVSASSLLTFLYFFSISASDSNRTCRPVFGLQPNIIDCSIIT
ncbi:hypothetical protein O0L34_g11800 [Tuta absoluta]|nr:hypothetical protein O0L34_g11800 [Tuta absoluta]